LSFIKEKIIHSEVTLFLSKATITTKISGMEEEEEMKVTQVSSFA
jgi:hypothetical protein